MQYAALDTAPVDWAQQPGPARALFSGIIADIRPMAWCQHLRAWLLRLPQGYSMLFQTPSESATYHIHEPPGPFDRMPTIILNTVNLIIFDRSAAISVLTSARQSMIHSRGMQLEPATETVLPIEGSTSRIRPLKIKVIIYGMFRHGTRLRQLSQSRSKKRQAYARDGQMRLEAESSG